MNNYIDSSESEDKSQTVHSLYLFWQKIWYVLNNWIEEVKWELGLAGFAQEKINGVQATSLGLGFGHWEWEKMLKIKKWEWDFRIAKWDLEKMNWEMGLVTRPPPPSGPSNCIGSSDLKDEIAVKSSFNS